MSHLRWRWKENCCASFFPDVEVRAGFKFVLIYQRSSLDTGHIYL
jgi:hypothetical protein